MVKAISTLSLPNTVGWVVVVVGAGVGVGLTEEADELGVACCGCASPHAVSARAVATVLITITIR